MASTGKFLLSIPVGLGFGLVGHYVFQEIAAEVNTDAIPMYDLLPLIISLVLMAAGMAAAMTFL